MKRALLGLICIILCFPVFSGCAPDRSGAGKVFGCDIPVPPASLDPQYASGPVERMIISNIFEGLLTRQPDGSLSPGAASSYEISEDGLEYTFHLRKDSGWAGKNGARVTASDFVFAFRRLFNPEAPSPFASDYLDIKNAEDILSGQKLESSLGVKAPDSRTLVITLELESPFFLQLLSETAAMPCNREFFESTMGRYGLESGLTGANGPFYVSRWTDKQITLLPNANYGSDTPTLAGGVNFYAGREKPLDRFFDGVTDISSIPYDQVEQALTSGFAVGSFSNTTWCIVFNQNSQTWKNALLRQGFALAVDYSYFPQRLAGNFEPSPVFIPQASTLGDKIYRNITDAGSPLEYDPAQALRIYKMGLDSLGYDSLPDTVFYVPDTDGHALNMGLVQQSWQKDLSAYVNVKPVPLAEIERRLVSGDYQVMLVPFIQSGARLENLLSRFTSSSPENSFGYKNPRYDRMLLEARYQPSAETAAKMYEQAEKTLLMDAVIIPVYTETTYYATAKGVSGVEIYPLGGEIIFKNALRS